MAFLRNRHRSPWALCCCLYLYCTNLCRPWGRTVVPLCWPHGSSALWEFVIFSTTKCKQKRAVMYLGESMILEPEAWTQSWNTHHVATQENCSSLEELQHNSSSLAAQQSMLGGFAGMSVDSLLRSSLAFQHYVLFWSQVTSVFQLEEELKFIKEVYNSHVHWM